VRVLSTILVYTCVFGAGLIGGFMAGSFASNGLKVSVVGRESMRNRFSGDFTVTDYQGHKAVVSDINFIGSGETNDIEFDFRLGPSVG